MDKKQIYSALQMAGFSKGAHNQLFLVSSDSPVTPAYVCNIVSKKGGYVFSGAVGIYVQAFELEWSNALSSEERRIDRSLPVIMAIENYLELIDLGIFDTIEEFDDALDISLCLYKFCTSLPASREEFGNSLLAAEILDRPISEYLHIVDYFDDNNLYLRKSVSFVRWIDVNWPEHSRNMRSCLTGSQLRRVEAA